MADRTIPKNSGGEGTSIRREPQRKDVNIVLAIMAFQSAMLSADI
jgi:hypothetical protein